MSKHSRFVWHDYNTPDVESAKRFYGELLGWHFFQGGGPEYQHVQVGERNIGGIMKYDGPAHWLGYVAADNVDETLQAAEHAGGKVLLAPKDLPKVGRFAMLADPQGGTVAPFHHISDHGAPDLNDPPALSTVAWNELAAPVGAVAAGFYAKVFDWSIELFDMGPAGTYRMLKRTGEKNQAGDDKTACGVLEMPQAKHAYWTYYFLVKDTDASVEHAQRLGASVIVPPSPLPNGGRFSLLLDAQKVAFGLMHVSR
jgi:predicted enzyme related to lactoylglutathione lyase